LIIKNKVEKAKKAQETFKPASENIQQPQAFEIQESAPVETGFKHLVEINQKLKGTLFMRSDAEIEAIREKNQAKMERASNSRKMNLLKKVDLAKKSQTMFGPSQELLQEIMAEKERIRKMHESHFDKKSNDKKSEAFMIRFDREGERTNDESSSERTVFIQSENEGKKQLAHLKQRPHIKQVVAKKKAIAFEIDRVENQGSKTTRNASKNDQWELL